MNNLINTEPAFPVNERDACGNHYSTYLGMTLRDYFAAKAMQVFCADNDYSLNNAAAAAYKQADAMLKVRREK